MQRRDDPAFIGQRYRVERELGRGGCATVYLAEDLERGGLVAVKVVRPELAYALGAERFRQEVALTAGLRHPGIIRVLDVGAEGDALFLVMPYVEGGTLRRRLEAERQLAVEEVVLLGRALADALGHAHENGLVHRDVKPENVLLRPDGSPVLTDFGFGHVLDRDAADRLTSSGLILGTPAYMSPEQAAGERSLDGRSDQYSLGCVLYEALAGVPPYVGPTARSLMAQRILHPPHPIKTMRANVPDAVADAVMRALAPVPADRYPSAAAFAGALSGTSAPALRPPPPHEWAGRRWRGPRRRAHAIAAAVTLAPVAYG